VPPLGGTPRLPALHGQVPRKGAPTAGPRRRSFVEPCTRPYPLRGRLATGPLAELGLVARSPSFDGFRVDPGTTGFRQPHQLCDPPLREVQVDGGPPCRQVGRLSWVLVPCRLDSQVQATSGAGLFAFRVTPTRASPRARRPVTGTPFDPDTPHDLRREGAPSVALQSPTSFRPPGCPSSRFVSATELGNRNEATRRTPRRAKARRALESERRSSSTTQVVAGIGVERRPGDGASRPRRSACRPGSKGPTRNANKPAPLIACTSEPSRRGTETHESRPTWRQGGPPSTCSSRRGGSHSWCGWRKPVVPGSTRKPSKDGERATRPSSARGSVASLPREGRGLASVRRKSVFEVQRSGPPCGGLGREGQGGAGCRREGARARRLVLQRPAGRGTGLAAGARKRSRGAW